MHLKPRGRHRPTQTDLPLLPDGWHFIAPADAVPGDGVLLPDGSVQRIGVRRFGLLPVEVRRQSWAVRPTHQTYPLPLVETWESSRANYRKPRGWLAGTRKVGSE